MTSRILTICMLLAFAAAFGSRSQNKRSLAVLADEMTTLIHDPDAYQESISSGNTPENDGDGENDFIDELVDELAPLDLFGESDADVDTGSDSNEANATALEDSESQMRESGGEVENTQDAETDAEQGNQDTEEPTTDTEDTVETTEEPESTIEETDQDVDEPSTDAEATDQETTELSTDIQQVNDDEDNNDDDVQIQIEGEQDFDSMITLEAPDILDNPGSPIGSIGTLGDLDDYHHLTDITTTDSVASEPNDVTDIESSQNVQEEVVEVPSGVDAIDFERGDDQGSEEAAENTAVIENINEYYETADVSSAAANAGEVEDSIINEILDQVDNSENETAANLLESSNTKFMSNQMTLDHDIVNFVENSDYEGLILPNYADRDEDAFPIPDAEDLDQQGDQSHDGAITFVLVTSFDEGEESSGKIWAVHHKSSLESGVLLTGLSQPVGTCFDVNNYFLYAVDRALDGHGYIYQYEINWTDDNEFELARPAYAVVYQGHPVYSCSVDGYGNLFFTTATNKINTISFVDLWSGFQNRHVTIYDNTSNKVSSSLGLDIAKGNEIWYVNYANTDTAGSLNHCKAETTTQATQEITTALENIENLQDLAVNRSNVWMVTSNEVLVYNMKDEDGQSQTIVSGLTNAKGITYGDGFIYVTDHDTGFVCKFEDDGDNYESISDSCIKIEGAYGVHAINNVEDFAYSLAASLLLILLS